MQKIRNITTVYMLLELQPFKKWQSDLGHVLMST